MLNRSQALLAGLKHRCAESNKLPEYAESFELGWLSSVVTQLIEGDAGEKRRARKDLQNLIALGRRLHLQKAHAAKVAAGACPHCAAMPKKLGDEFCDTCGTPFEHVAKQKGEVAA